MNNLSILFICLILFVKCGSPKINEDVIKLPIRYDLTNVLSFSESEYEYDIKIIPLENKIDAFIMFEQQRMEVYKNFFYIMSLGKDIKIFDKNGKYLTKINKGRGPGELVFAYDISFDTQAEKLEVLDANEIKIFDLIGNFEMTVSCGNRYVEFVKYGDKRIFYDSNKDKSQEYNFIIKYNSGDNGYFEKKYGPTLKPIYSPRHFSIYNGSLYMCSNYSNTIYKMGHKDNIPMEFAYVEAMNDIRNIKGIDLKEYDDLCLRNEWFNNISGFYLIDENLFEICIGKDRIRTYLYDSNKNTFYYHPFKDVPALFQPKFVDETGEYFLFPPEIFNEKTKSMFMDNNPMFYSKLMECMKQNLDLEKDMENIYVVQLSYSKKQR